MSINEFDDRVNLDASGVCNHGIECEIALFIGADAESKTYSRETIGEIIKAALPAIEIVENPYGDFRIRGAPTLIADDFST